MGRTQLQSDGWRMPEDSVYVGLGSPWATPFVARAGWERAAAIVRFAQALYGGRLAFSVGDVRRELVGKTLVCNCPIGGACHADVLLEIANPKENDG